jgi:tetratricopeptide (TPR) repeat protein
MNPHALRIVPALMMLTACLGLSAQTTGRIVGKVVNKKGEPLPNAIVTLKRIDITWVKPLTLTPKGTFLQVGLDPKEFDLQVSCPGYTEFTKRVKIPLGEMLTENVTMLTAEETLAEARAAGKAPVEDPGVKAENEATEATNQAISFYKEKKYAEALPLLEMAQTKFKDSIEKTKATEAKATLESNLATTERVLGIVMAHTFVADPSKAELASKAVPLLEKSLAKKADDPFTLQAIVDLARAKKDADLEKKYLPALNKLVGPKPETAYNDAVIAFNAGNSKEAKEFLLKALKIDPKFPESYYLLGMVEYANMNLKGCKEALLKYLELDPNGKKAGDVKEMLNDPSLKKIK